MVQAASGRPLATFTCNTCTEHDTHKWQHTCGHFGVPTASTTTRSNPTANHASHLCPLVLEKLGEKQKYHNSS